MSREKVIINTNLPLALHSHGKVRDNYDLGKKLLMVATDRISAFDHVVGAIPGKGKNLNRLSAFWFIFSMSMVKNHMISIDLSYAQNHGVWMHASEFDLEGRSMVVEKMDAVLPVECVVRGYLAGSGLEEYKGTGKVCGNPLEKGLVEASELDSPIFTPATKAEAGLHDENISFDRMVEVMRSFLGKESESGRSHHWRAGDLAEYLRDTSILIYKRARTYALKRGIIIADTKMEFGLKNGTVFLIDELLTPDSSRFWPADKWQPGRPQESFDKQFLRDYLKSIGWNRQPPVPELPAEVIQKTKEKYEEAAKRLLSV